MSSTNSLMNLVHCAIQSDRVRRNHGGDLADAVLNTGTVTEPERFSEDRSRELQTICQQAFEVIPGG